MSTEAFVMPNEGHLGGFDIRRFIKKFMTIGLLISLGVHTVAIGSYYFGVYLASRQIPPPTRVIYIDPSNLGPPPSISGEELAPALKIAQPKLAPPAAAIPKPVAAEVAPEQPQIQTQQQLSEQLNTQIDTLAMAGGENIEIKQAIPTDEEIPESPTFTPYEQEPQVVKRIEPAYPDMAAQAGVNGKVVVQFYVDKKGNVRKALVMQADPKGLGFEDAAVAAIMQWKFTPALQRNSPVGVWMSTKFNFKIK
jgi:protein TonB